MVSSGGEVLLGPFRVLGTASRFVSARKGNPSHDRMLPFGDPPCGTYTIASSLPPGSIHARRPGRFGKLGALVLVAAGGPALAAKARGREHVVLHGGPRDHHRRLRRTRGGLRVGNRNLAALFTAINQAQANSDPLDAIEVVDLAAGFEDVRPLPPARKRRRARTSLGATAAREGMPAAAVAAMAIFGVSRATPTRRGFLAAALLAVAGGRMLGGCVDHPDRCVRECEAEYGSGAGSGSAMGSDVIRRAIRSGSGSGSNAVQECIDECEAGYESGGGVG